MENLFSINLFIKLFRILEILAKTQKFQCQKGERVYQGVNLQEPENFMYPTFGSSFDGDSRNFESEFLWERLC